MTTNNTCKCQVSEFISGMLKAAEENKNFIRWADTNKTVPVLDVTDTVQAAFPDYQVELATLTIYGNMPDKVIATPTPDNKKIENTPKQIVANWTKYGLNGDITGVECENQPCHYDPSNSNTYQMCYVCYPCKLTITWANGKNPFAKPWYEDPKTLAIIGLGVGVAIIAISAMNRQQ